VTPDRRPVRRGRAGKSCQPRQRRPQCLPRRPRCHLAAPGAPRGPQRAGHKDGDDRVCHRLRATSLLSPLPGDRSWFPTGVPPLARSREQRRSPSTSLGPAGRGCFRLPPAIPAPAGCNLPSQSSSAIG
jgi:hypothetical protein